MRVPAGIDLAFPTPVALGAATLLRKRAAERVFDGCNQRPQGLSPTCNIGATPPFPVTLNRLGPRPIERRVTGLQLEPDPADRKAETSRFEIPGAGKKSSDPESPWATEGRSRRVLGMRVDGTNYAEAVEAITDRAIMGSGATVCVSSVNMVMEAVDTADFRRIVNSADLVTPDGVPLVWALRALGVARATRVYGPALTTQLCRRAEVLDIPVGFYGGSPDVLDTLVGRVATRFPGLRIVFASSPPFRELSQEEDESAIAAILASGVQILFVGLGCPKQERWMAAHREHLPCALVGVGAAFDFLAGAKPQAPGWMGRSGLEWLFRLCTEPRRLWRRYLIGNPRFVAHFARQWLATVRSPSS